MHPIKVLRTLVGRARAYVNRLIIWLRVAREIRGKDAKDRDVLNNAFRRAWFTSLQRLDIWQDPHVENNCIVEVPGIGEFCVRAKTDDLYHVLPSREPAIYSSIKDVLGEGDIFVDAGANIGFYTIVAARQVGASGRVVAVEMMPDTAEILRSHVQKNACTNVVIIERALSDRTDELVEAHVECGKFGQATISDSKNGTAVRVKTTTLEALLRDIDRVALIKMDLEGAESQALLGAGEAIDRIERIIFEDRSGSGEAGAILRAKGFRLRSLDRANVLAVKDGVLEEP
jgi:FkbM family methyltransferase